MVPGIPSDEDVSAALEGLSIVRVSSETPTPMYILGDNSLGDLKAFAALMGITAVFSEPAYVDPAALRIDDRLLEDLPPEIRSGVQLDAHSFNRELDRMVLSAPVELRVFALHEGRAFGVRFVDEELDAFRRFTAEDRLEGFVRSRTEKVPAGRSMEGLSAQREDPGIERFVELLIKDPEYRRMPNDDERFNYVVKVARRPGNDALREGIAREGGRGFSTEKVRRVVALSVKRMDLGRTEPKQMVFGGK